MKTIYFNHITPDAIVPCVATVGFFDGVHRGHQYLIEHVIGEAKQANLTSVVITFDRHPRQVLRQDYQPELLTTLDSKLLLLSKTGIDTVIIIPFDEAMATLTAHDFMAQVLRDRLQVRKLVIGYDNRFGHNRAEGFDDYVRYGRALGIEVVRHQAFVLNGVNVSSSVVRAFIREGEIELANQCLGYPYTIAGRVVEGYKEGRRMGFPTANLDTAEFGQLIPACGVYAVKVRQEQTVAMRPGMTNIGSRPTFNGTGCTVETFIFNFQEDLYGKVLFISFVHRIREERKFDNVTLLIERLKEDEKLVEEQFNKDNENE